jgi:hypothetical protein
VVAFEHPAFQNLIHIASRATRTIDIMNRKQTRTEIILLFKAQMSKLKELLNVRVLSPYALRTQNTKFIFLE